MKKTSYFLLLSTTLLFAGCTSSQISSTVSTVEKVLAEDGKLSSDDVANGLKEALQQGVSKGAAQASQVDGYYKNELLKIIMPPEMQKVDSKLRSLGMNKLMDDFELSLNRGAEDAAKEAKPIFVKAITSMTIQDAWNILKGDKDAATQYLRKTTTPELTAAFNPVIKNSLTKVNATKYYSDIIGTYNKIPFVEKVNPNLDEYVTGKAVDGMFVLVKQEEANIRENPLARTTDLLKKVFTSANMSK